MNQPTYMYKIKENQEDFVVNEIIELEFDKKGEYSYFLLKKTNLNTEEALKRVADLFRIDRKRINACGNKDKIAVTTQHVSAFNITEKFWKDHKFENLKLEYLGQGKERLNLGSHEGNKFIIKVRDVKDFRIKDISKVPNLFGEQRFSKNNAEIGKAIVKKDFGKAVELILENVGDYEDKIRDHLINKPNDYIGAIKKIPRKIATLFIHAYQSRLFNETIRKIRSEKNIKIPIIGFGTDENNRYVKNIMKEENISQRDFIIRQFPEISSEGGERDLFMNVKGFEYEKKENEVILKFYLGKGSYATVLVDYLFNP